MRAIGTVNGQEQAERFSDYLVSQGIDNLAEEGKGGWIIWVDRDDDLDRAAGELAQFQARPDDAKYASARQAAVKKRQAEAKRQKKLQLNYHDVRTGWAGAGRQAQPLAIVLIAISVGVALFTQLGENDQSPVLYYALLFMEEVKRGQVWRLVTPIFLHFGILHLLFNMFWIADLGGRIEAARGTGRFAALVLFCALTSCVAQYVASGPYFGGMSGVVYGLFGYVWVKMRYEPYLGLGVAQQTIVIMMVWLVLCMTGMVGPVANTAHAVGLVAGAAWAYVPYGLGRMRRGMR